MAKNLYGNLNGTIVFSGNLGGTTNASDLNSGVLALAYGGTGQSSAGSTGSGNVVFSTMPTFQGIVAVNGNVSADYLHGNIEGTLEFFEDFLEIGNLTCNAGTASAPAYSFSASPDTGAYSPGANEYAISTGGSERFAADSGGVRVTGNVYATGDVVGFSDRSVKGNVRIIDSALDKVSRLNGYTFDRTDIPTGRRFAGLIAQEVVGVMDEVVHANPDGTLALAYPNMCALLIEAIKELRAKVDALVSK